MPANTQRLAFALLTSISLGLLSCAGSGTPDGAPAGAAPSAQVAWPQGLPADGVQPWETLDARGFVQPAVNGSLRGVSAINGASLLTEGADRFQEAGGVTDNGAASHFSSGGAGDKELSFALYRVPLGGEQPGAVSLDVNLLERSGAAPPARSGYYVGLSDYDAAVWEWHGPFSDSQVRLGRVKGATAGPEGLLRSTDYTSTLGNLFVAVVAYDGAQFDVVDMGVNPEDTADTTAPPAPAALGAVLVNGGVEVFWTPVIAADLAGYRIYYSPQPFATTVGAGVKALDYFHGGTRTVLPLPQQQHHIRVTAVDLSGNESPLSESQARTPINQPAPLLLVTTDLISGMIGEAASLNVSAPGGMLFDYDLNGDGDFEISGSSLTTQQIDTGAAGLIRPAVRAQDDAGEAVAHGSVTLFISGNSRPVASALAAPASGPAPLNVALTGTGVDDDGTIELYSYDFDGDGLFEYNSPSQPNTNHSYTPVGIYNTKFRVEDNDGSWDVDTLVISATAGSGPALPVARLTASPPEGNPGETVLLDASTSTAGTGSIVKYEWDLNNDGVFEFDTGTTPTKQTVVGGPGNYVLSVKVTNNAPAPASSTKSFTVPIHGWGQIYEPFPDGTQPQFDSLCMVNGRPALGYFELGLDGGAYYMRANDSNGVSWPAPVPVDISGHCWYPMLIMVNGRPAMCYYDNVADQLKYCRALDADGTEWGSVKTPDPTISRGPHCSMAMVNGVPAIAYQDNLTKDLYFVRAQNSSGGLWNAPEPVVTVPDTGYYTSLAVVNGFPAIAYMDETDDAAMFVRAMDENGDAWNPPVLAHGGVGQLAGHFAKMMVIDGVPCIAAKYLSSADLHFIRAIDANGEFWNVPKVLDGAATSVGDHVSLALIEGRPAVLYLDGGVGKIMLVKAADAGGGVWGAPQAVQATPSNYQGFSLGAIGGKPCFSYINSNSNSMHFTRSY